MGLFCGLENGVAALTYLLIKTVLILGSLGYSWISYL